MSIRKSDAFTVHRGRNVADVMEFIESGWECAEIELDGREPEKVSPSIRSMLKRKGIGDVKVFQRGRRVFLVRRDA